MQACCVRQVTPGASSISTTRHLPAIRRRWQRLEPLPSSHGAHTSENSADRQPLSIWQEWIQVQLDRSLVYYWLNQVDAMDAIEGELEAAVERYGTPSQRAVYLAAQEQHRVSPQPQRSDGGDAALAAAVTRRTAGGRRQGRFARRPLRHRVLPGVRRACAGGSRSRSTRRWRRRGRQATSACRHAA